jgi:FkbH-like protein
MVRGRMPAPDSLVPVGGIASLRRLLETKDPAFWTAARTATATARSFEDMFGLQRLVLKARRDRLAGEPPAVASARLAVLGAVTPHPLVDFARHILELNGIACELFVGKFDNYVAEIVEQTSSFNTFRPDTIVLFPSSRHVRPPDSLTDPPSQHRATAARAVEDLLALCTRAHEQTGAEVILANFLPPAHHHLGPFGSRTLASAWNFRRLVNIELGLAAPPFVHICDLEFLGARRGLLNVVDERAWFESKQPGSPDFLVDVAGEIAHRVQRRRQAAKKVLVTDLDETLWGGVIGDDGLTGIELGDTSPRGEAFKAFQRYLMELNDRGILLAVCSKNEDSIAKSVFREHPDAVLKLDHFAAFKANWRPKPDNLREIANELSLGLDSLVFVDDNPAEVEFVRQACPEVTAIHLAPDPSRYVACVQESRLFEVQQLTEEDRLRARSYRDDGKRRMLLDEAADMDSYLGSLEMVATVAPLGPIDLPRATQLVNKSNQFNPTTRRRTEAEMTALLAEPNTNAFTLRLADRFGDHGLISVIVAIAGEVALEIDTWVMSCRVLKRGVEDVAMAELLGIARSRGCRMIVGRYLPTARNELVRGLFPDLGFTLEEKTEDQKCTYRLDVAGAQARPTQIKVQRHSS